MLKKFGLPTLVLGTALSLLSPALFARDYDRDDYRRQVRHERVYREHRPHFRVYVGPTYSPYRYGYYDRWGYWHPGPGYYDAWGIYHPY